MNFLSKFNEFPQQINWISSANQLNFLSKSIWITKPFDVTNADHHILWSICGRWKHFPTTIKRYRTTYYTELWSSGRKIRNYVYAHIHVCAREKHAHPTCHTSPATPMYHYPTRPHPIPQKEKSEQHLPLGLLMSIDLKLLTRQTSDLRLQTSDFRPLLTRILVHGTFPFLPVVCGKTTFIYQCIVGCLIFYFECARFIWVDSFIWQPINKAISCNLVAWCQHCDGC